MQLFDDGIAQPVLVGNENIIKKEIQRIGYDLAEFTIKDPNTLPEM
jgi:phosphotransacetylase